MNVNLNVPSHPAETPDMETVQHDIEEHIEIMRNAGQRVGLPAMLLTDPEYDDGVFRVWLRVLPLEGTTQQSALETMWCWVDPMGEIHIDHWPWTVTP